MDSRLEVLSGAQPVLSHRANGWVLELERLVRIGVGHYRPRKLHVSGRAPIMRQLRHEGVRSSVVKQVEAMMSAPNTEHGAFRLGSESLEPVEPLEEQDRSTDQVRKLEARIDLLMRANAQLQRRVAKLESGMGLRAVGTRPMSQPDDGRTASARGGRPRPSLDRRPEARAASPARPAASPMAQNLGASPEGDREAAEAASPMAQNLGASPEGDDPEARAAEAEAVQAQPEPQPAEAEPQPAEAEPQPAEAEPQPAEAEAQPAEAEAQPAEAEAQPVEKPAEEPDDLGDPILKLPSVNDYQTALEALLDEELALTVDDSHPDLTKGTCFLSPLLDDEGKLVGALVADLASTVRQGGTLVMLSESAVEEMITEGAPSKDARDAMAELFNVQSATLNDIRHNPHIKVGDFVAVDAEEHVWLRRTAARLDFTDPHGGRTSIVSRGQLEK